MTNSVLLNNVDHGDLHIDVRHAARFGDSVNQTLIFPTEFADIAREYPIVFRKEGDSYHAVALLGFDKDENLFLDDDAGWQARTIPAVHQRGPFMIGLGDPDAEGNREPMILVDMESPRIASSGGQRVFLPQGGNTPYLDHIAAVLRVIHVGMEVNGPMFAMLKEMELIAPVTFQVSINEEKRYDFPDCFVIAQDRMASLSGDALARLNAQGYLGAVFAVMSSLGNMSQLIALKNRRMAAAG